MDAKLEQKARELLALADRMDRAAATPSKLFSSRSDEVSVLRDEIRRFATELRALQAQPAEGGVPEGKRRVFVDMDGVIVDFDRYRDERGMTGDEVKRTPGAYLAMPAIPGAIEAVRSIIGMGYEVWIATKPPTGVPYAYSDKAAWIMEHLPELKRRIIITHDKGLLGGPADFLCDDRPHKANCKNFTGTLLSFIAGYHWPHALDDLRQQAPNNSAAPRPATTTGEGVG